jgi:hypothetical protein
MKITAIKINEDELQLLDDTDLPNGIPIRLCYNILSQSHVTGTKQGNLLKDIHKNSKYNDELKQWENIPIGQVFNLYCSLPWKNIVLKFFIKSLGFFSLIYLLSFFITIDLTKNPDSNPPNTPPFNITIKENTQKQFETKGWIALAILLLTYMDWLGLNKVSFGLLANGFNFEILKEKLDQVGEGQEKNEKNIHKLVGFLLKNSLNKEEWGILYDLYHNSPHTFEPTPDLKPLDTSPDIPENQFRRLRNLGLIVRKDGEKLEFPCKDMENQDINQFITLTEDAIMNIQFIREVVGKD